MDDLSHIILETAISIATGKKKDPILAQHLLDELAKLEPSVAAVLKIYGLSDIKKLEIIREYLAKSKASAWCDEIKR